MHPGKKANIKRLVYEIAAAPPVDDVDIDGPALYLVDEGRRLAGVVLGKYERIVSECMKEPSWREKYSEGEIRVRLNDILQLAFVHRPDSTIDAALDDLASEVDGYRTEQV